ncbi:MAG: TrkH family potassium uptake protein [Candidatus Bipolaricaulota bacterium]
MRRDSWLIRLRYLGTLLWVYGFIIPLPLILVPFLSDTGFSFTTILPFLIPSVISLSLGGLLNRSIKLKPISGNGAIIVVVLGWFIISAIGALPFTVGLRVGFIDAFFEATSGFTTTGITLLTGLDKLPKTLLFWRSLTQWVGGLGILTLFSVLVFKGEASHKLFGAESHKVISERPAPGLFSTLKILWSIYSLFTAVVAVMLLAEGVGWFDSLNHALTTLSTGGFSTHDASIDYFRQAGFGNYRLIEYTLVAGMTLGGISFVVHYRVLRGRISSLWNSMEIKLFWKIIAGATLLVFFDHLHAHGFGEVLNAFRTSLFQVVSLLTTTGFGTKDIGGSFFPAMSKQIFLFLMVVGGMVGSTGGGLKVFRVGVLWKAVKNQVKKTVNPSRAVSPLIVDGERVPQEEIGRISTLFFAWVVFILGGGMIAAFFSDLSPLAAVSGMFSALGNIGPSYVPLKEWASLHPIIKITYTIGMLAGRLEILPILLLFSRKVWR